MDCYEIELNNNKKIRTANTHFNPVCFRQENKKKIWDNITTQFIVDNFNKYKFEWFDESNYKDFNDFKILLKFVYYVSTLNNPTIHVYFIKADTAKSAFCIYFFISDTFL